MKHDLDGDHALIQVSNDCIAVLQVDFANRQIGGGTLGRGRVQVIFGAYLRPNKKIHVLRETRPYLNLLVKLIIFSDFGEKI